jgi:hypothetical protein
MLFLHIIDTGDVETRQTNQNPVYQSGHQGLHTGLDRSALPHNKSLQNFHFSLASESLQISHSHLASGAVSDPFLCHLLFQPFCFQSVFGFRYILADDGSLLSTYLILLSISRCEPHQAQCIFQAAIAPLLIETVFHFLSLARSRAKSLSRALS